MPGLDARQAQGVQIGSWNVQYNYFYQENARISWPHVVGAIPLTADCFQRRRVVVQQLDEALGRSGTAVLCQVLSGMGGVGKTQLAANFARQQLEAPTIDLLVWVTGSTREAIQATYAQASTEIIGGSLRDAQQDAVRFLGWLHTTKRPWLVVIDDLADPGDLRGLWPEGGSGHTIVTTRRRDAVLRREGRRIVEVGLFSQHEAVEYLTTKFGGDQERLDQAAELAEDLGLLPLALAQASAFILDHSGETCRSYRTRWADRRRKIAEILPADAYADDYQSTVAATWSLSIEIADGIAPAGLARPALSLAAVLDPNGAPDVLFACPPIIDYLSMHRTNQPSHGPPEATEPARLPDHQDALDALSCLHRLNLISHDAIAGARAVRMHALVQRAVLEQTIGTIVDQTVKAAADGLQNIWPDLESDSDFVRSLRDNAVQLLERHEARLWTSDGCHPVLFRLGTALGESGLVYAASEHWQKIVSRAEQVLGVDHPQTLAAQASVAFWENEAGNPAAAVVAAQRLLRNQLRVLGADHPSTFVTRGNLSHYRGEAGDLAGAVSGYRELLVDRVRVLGPDHPHTLITRHGLANWRGEAGDPVTAVEEFQALLVDRLRILGPDHPDTLSTRHCLAFWRGESGEPARAAEACCLLLGDRLRVLGPNHHDTLISRANLAYWRGQAGDYAGAAGGFAELVGDVVRVLGPDHPHTLITRVNLAFWGGQAGDWAGALSALGDLADDAVRILGADHPQTHAARSVFARARGEAGDPVGAARAFGDLLDDAVRVLGADHPQTLAVRSGLARWRGEAGDPAAASAAFGDLVDDVARVLGPDHPHVLAMQQNQDFWRRRATDVHLDVNINVAELRAEGSTDPLGNDNQVPPDIVTTRHGLSYWRGQA